MHPAVKLIKSEMTKQKITLLQIAHLSDISYNRVRNLMSGRTAMTLKERDSICTILGVSPINFLITRSDLIRGVDELYLDISWMAPELRCTAISFYKELRRQFELNAMDSNS